MGKRTKRIGKCGIMLFGAMNPSMNYSEETVEGGSGEYLMKDTKVKCLIPMVKSVQQGIIVWDDFQNMALVR
jgi:hypothetical protein